MRIKLDVYSMFLGLLIGVVMLCVLGAAAGPKEGYQLSIAANGDYVFFARMHAASGKIETWKYRSYGNQAIPLHGDKTDGQLAPRVVD